MPQLIKDTGHSKEEQKKVIISKVVLRVRLNLTTISEIGVMINIEIAPGESQVSLGYQKCLEPMLVTRVTYQSFGKTFIGSNTKIALKRRNQIQIILQLI